MVIGSARAQPFPLFDLLDRQNSKYEDCEGGADEQQDAAVSMLHDLIETVPTSTARDRKILKLRYWRGRTLDEIAKSIDRSITIVSMDAVSGRSPSRAHALGEGRQQHSR